MSFIEIKDLSFGYTKHKTVINNMNLNLKENQLTAIVGSNGSGKTTLGKLIMGILKPNSGQVHISKNDLADMTLGEVATTIGYLFQNPEKHFFTNTVEEELSFVLKFKGKDKDYIEREIEYLLDLFQLRPLRKSSPLLLSQGEKQRLAIASILINKPKYLILDEPTTGLDLERKHILVDLLKELIDKEIGMMVISHDRLFIEELAQRVIYIEKGEIVHDQRR